MPTFQPNVPTGTVPLNQDYLNLQGNNQQLNIAYGIDHVPFTDTSGAPPGGQTGVHKAIHLLPVSTTASNPPNNQPVNGYTATPNFGQLFDAKINDGLSTDDALFFLTGGNKLTQLSRNFQPSSTGSSGATYLPGGLIFNWGLSTVNLKGASTTITFTQPFTTGAPVITIGCVNNSGENDPSANNVQIRASAVSLTEFKVVNSASGTVTQIMWMAIGK